MSGKRRKIASRSMGTGYHCCDNACGMSCRHSGRCPGQVAYCDLLYCCHFCWYDLLLQKELVVEAVLGNYCRGILGASATSLGGFRRRLAAKEDIGLVICLPGILLRRGGRIESVVHSFAAGTFTFEMWVGASTAPRSFGQNTAYAVEKVVHNACFSSTKCP